MAGKVAMNYKVHNKGKIAIVRSAVEERPMRPQE